VLGINGVGFQNWTKFITAPGEIEFIVCVAAQKGTSRKPRRRES
jgi:hypothetical protein